MESEIKVMLTNRISYLRMVIFRAKSGQEEAWRKSELKLREGDKEMSRYCKTLASYYGSVANIRREEIEFLEKLREEVLHGCK